MDITQIIKNDYPLSDLNTFKVGGSAKYYAEVSSKEELLEVLDWAKNKDLRILILGGGSNILVSESGIDALVLRMNNANAVLRGERIEGGAGARLADVSRKAVGHNLGGLEWSFGIPRATLGGSVRGNAGAFGCAMADIVETCEVYNMAKGRFETFSNKDCAFVYRGSIFKNDPGLIVWNIILKLKPDKGDRIRKFVDEVVEFRSQRQPKLPSAGSTFRNLEKEEVKNNNPGLYKKLTKQGLVRGGKISAGAIIEQAGLSGKTIGSAKISLEHSNFIVNTGHATAEQIIMLISYIKQQVRDKYGIQLLEEVEYFGFKT